MFCLFLSISSMFVLPEGTVFFCSFAYYLKILKKNLRKSVFTKHVYIFAFHGACLYIVVWDKIWLFLLEENELLDIQHNTHLRYTTICLYVV